ncbi:MAG TPA: CDP-glycerol glycerophosphotransferase family protein [Vicinamibacterales bacterium]|nr:CDP-glycerol glycerophosphotransferase family protein [Vicinamibacterales bacterium]
MVRRLTRALHALDHAIGRAGGTRRILVELRTPVYQAVLRPVYETLLDLPYVDLQFTSEYPDVIRPLVGAERFLTHGQAEWRRFDVYLNADPWAAARLRRCAYRINFFHGVAGKYDLDDPRNLPLGYQYYDRVAFINRDRMTRYLEAGIVAPRQARLVGYPKLDRLALGRVSGAAVLAALGLRNGAPTVLYAPTYSTASSLHLAGEAIVTGLAAAGLNVIVKLHDRSLDRDPRYTGGIDWRARMRVLEQNPRVKFVEGPDSSPYLAAADAMVTDHSSVGFEYLVLDRPLFVFDAPNLASVARINPEKIELLRSAATVVADVPSLVAAVRAGMADPSRLGMHRRRVAREMFHDPGNATSRAVALVRELLEQRAAEPTVDVSAAPARGGIS